MDSKFKKNFLKGSAAASIGTISSMVFHFASIMLLTRHMPKDEFGLYALVLVITYLFSIIGGLGLEYTLVRYEVISKDEDRKSVLFPILILRAITLLIISIIFIFSANFLLNLFDKRLTTYVFSLTLLSIINSFRDLLFNYLQGRNLFRRFAVVQTSAAASRVLMIIIYLMINKLSLDSLIFIEIITSIFPLVFLLLSIPPKELFNFSSNIEKYKELIKFSMPLYGNHILTFAYDRITVFMVGGMLTPASVASYDVAGKIPDSLKRIFASFTIVFFPGMSNLLAQGNRKDALALMNKSLVIFANAISFGVLLSFLFSNDIIRILFSSAYSESGIGFALLMVNFCLRALSNIMGYSLVSAGYSAVPMKANFISSIISITGGFLLIPIYGFMGAVYAVLIMSIVAQFSYTYFLYKADLRPDTYAYIKPFLILIPAVALYILFDIQSLVIRLIIILAYMIASVFFIEEIRNGILNKIIRGNIDKAIL